MSNSKDYILYKNNKEKKSFDFQYYVQYKSLVCTTLIACLLGAYRVVTPKKEEVGKR
jgi:hypothetical protein